jgi:hypothetical protein
LKTPMRTRPHWSDVYSARAELALNCFTLRAPSGRHPRASVIRTTSRSCPGSAVRGLVQAPARPDVRGAGGGGEGGRHRRPPRRAGTTGRRCRMAASGASTKLLMMLALGAGLNRFGQHRFVTYPGCGGRGWAGREKCNLRPIILHSAPLRRKKGLCQPAGGPRPTAAIRRNKRKVICRILPAKPAGFP